MLLFSILVCAPGYAQKGLTVTGKVINSDNEPIIGAGVQEKDITNGTVTDLDGNYSITIQGDDAVLVFSSLGYASAEEIVGNRSVINVTLIDDVVTLENAVVVGYGSQLKTSVTGAISSVKEKDFKAPNAVSIDASLKGKVAGLTLSQSSAQPGSAVSANIRGELSPHGSNAPLYVIDGVIINSNSNTASKLGPTRLMDYSLRDGANRSPLSTINPNDIASVDVLKDASATAIYGSAAANGVILITTKKGQSGKPVVTYSGSVSVQETKTFLEPLSSAEFFQWGNDSVYENWLWANKYYPYGTTQPPTSGYTVLYTQDEVNKYSSQNYNHVNEILRTGFIQDHNVSINGGVDKFKVYASFNYYDNTPILKGSDLKRYSGRVNMEAIIAKWLKVNINSMYTFNKANNPSIGHWRENANEANLTNAALYFPPYKALTDGKGNLTAPDYGNSNNPLKYLQIKDQSTTKRLFFTPNFEITFCPWLKLNAQISVDKTDDSRDVWSPTTAKMAQQIGDNYGAYSNGYNNNYSAEEYFTFNKKSGKNYINAVLGTGYYIAEGNSYGFSVFNLPTDVLENNALQMSSDVEMTTYNSNRWKRTKMSFFGRINYSYDDRYVFGATLRRDGSSVFAANHKWGSFPGVSAAWNASNEEFLKGVNWIDFLKLRAGWGTSGNESILTNNNYSLTTFGSANFGGWYYFDGALVNGIYQLQKGNPNLKWETDITFDVGIDYNFFGNRLSGSIDYYIRTAKDLLDFAKLPINDLMNRQAKNIGSTRSTGIEFSARGTMIQKKDFEWSGYFNIAHNHSFWLERNPEVSLNPWESQKDDLSSLFGWETAGIFKTQEEIQQWTSNGQVLQPKAYVGNLKYVDQNGDGKLDDDDIVFFGNSQPFAVYGLGTSFRWKNWTLDIAGYGVLGQLRKYSWGYSGIMVDKLNTSVHCYDRWTSKNPEGFLAGIASDQTANSNSSGYNNYTLKRTSYLRFSDIVLTYNLPENLVKNAKISNAAVYLDLQNTALITNFEGYDPEMERNSSPYPIPFTMVLGVNLSF
jgi:TonB-linked SusC/RagA family outer membrane protein